MNRGFVITVVCAIAVSCVRDALAQHKGLRVVSVIPSPISGRDIARYHVLLELTEAQGKFLHAVHAGYEERYVAEVDQTIAKMIPLSNLVSQGYARGIYDQTFKANRTEFLDHESRCLKALSAMDAGLFATLSSILAEPQQDNLQRALWHRARQCCATSEWEMYSAQVDLSALVEEMSLRPEEMAQVEASLAAYEAAITPVMLRLNQQALTNRAELMSIIVDNAFGPDNQPWPPSSPETIQRQERNKNRRAGLLQESAQLQRRCSELNKQFAPQVCAQLPERVQQRFQNQLLRNSFPYAVYPDQSDPQHVSSLLIEQLRDEALIDAQAKYAAYRAHYEATCAEMSQMFDERRFEKARTKGVADYAPYRARMSELRDLRWSLNEGIVKQLFAMVGTDQQVAVREDYETYLRVLKSVQAEVVSRDRPGP